jgi:hypothetical protein
MVADGKEEKSNLTKHDGNSIGDAGVFKPHFRFNSICRRCHCFSNRDYDLFAGVGGMGYGSIT